MEIDLRVSYIWEEGRLDIGSEECPYEGKTTITLTGKPLVSVSLTLFRPMNFSIQLHTIKSVRIVHCSYCCVTC